MPARLRPTTPIAADAVLVGDPGRALLLAQELLIEPKMSNHARGLWGYTGKTPAGSELTIQTTGMGGPSAAVVLADLAKLGLRRAIRVGTCVGLDPALAAGTILIVGRAIAAGGSGEAFGLAAGEAAVPDPGLTDGLERELAGAAPPAAIASYDVHDEHGSPPPEAVAADMQTATVLSRCRSLEIVAAAALIVERSADGERVDDETLEEAAKRAGRLAGDLLSS
jgi:purine-nucleoside phosphorylase